VTSSLDHQALDRLYSLAYEELRRLARAVLRSDGAASRTPTTLVNEAWLKLARSPEVADTSPLHFRRIAARAMRQVLVEAARRKRSQMRGGGQLHVTFDESLEVLSPSRELGELLSLDAALSALGKIAPRQAQLVEGRFFGGLSWVEAGESLGISEATVMREWRAARAWLAWHMKHAEAPRMPVPAGGE
jgi:RNA polymerase sigma factor (TIGR02999 family)